MHCAIYNRSLKKFLESYIVDSGRSTIFFIKTGLLFYEYSILYLQYQYDEYDKYGKTSIAQ